MVTIDDLALNHGQHGIAPSKTEQADFEESVEELQEDDHTVSSFRLADSLRRCLPYR